MPQPAALVLRNWATALVYLAKLVQQPVLQGNNISKTFTLCSLLRKKGVDLAGISVRPVMPQADLTAEVLGSKTPHVSAQGLWALPHIPKAPALINIPLIQGDTPDACTSMKNRFKRHLRASGKPALNRTEGVPAFCMFSRWDLCCHGRAIGGLKTGLSFTLVSLRPNLARATTVGLHSRPKFSYLYARSGRALFL